MTAMVGIVKATLSELNSNSSALARAAQEGEVVVITDRGKPIVDMVPHVADTWVARDELVDRLRVLRDTVLNPAMNSDAVRQELDDVVDPFVGIGTD